MPNDVPTGHHNGKGVDAIIPKNRVDDNWNGFASSAHIASGFYIVYCVFVCFFFAAMRHLLLIYMTSATKTMIAAPTMTVRARPWRRLDVEQFRSELSAWRLCRPNEWPDDVDDLAALYTDELCSTEFYLKVSSCNDSGHQTSGLTRNVAMQSVSLVS